MSYLQTIDLDTNETTQYVHTLVKLRACKHRDKTRFKIEPSVSTNGFHFIYYCTLETCMCRFTLDDQNRFHKDQERPIESQNVLFSRKQFRANDKVVLRLEK